MANIYKSSTYVLAVPDLHIAYLNKNTANQEIINLLKKCDEKIYKDILESNEHHYHQKEEKGKEEKQEEEEELKRIYQYLAYLLEDWSNRVWNISECQIAKDKYEQYGTPLKYMFMSLLRSSFTLDIFFNFPFHTPIIDKFKEKHQCYSEVNNSRKLVNLLKQRLVKRSFLEMVLNSNATMNEHRFTAILPSWKKYNHVIKNENTIFNWNITDMTSVRLKLYDIVEDLWDKAILLLSCSRNNYGSPIIPTFATNYSWYHSNLIEKDKCELAHDFYKKKLLNEIKMKDEKEKNRIEQYIDDYKIKNGSIYTENLTHIQLIDYNDHSGQHYINQLKQRQLEPNNNPYNPPSSTYYLTVQSNIYFAWKLEFNILNAFDLSKYLLFEENGKMNEWVDYVFIPFFSYILPDYVHVQPPSRYCSGITLVGNMDKNRWIVFHSNGLDNTVDQNNQFTYSLKSDHYIFNII